MDPGSGSRKPTVIEGGGALKWMEGLKAKHFHTTKHFGEARSRRGPTTQGDLLKDLRVRANFREIVCLQRRESLIVCTALESEFRMSQKHQQCVNY